MVKKCSDNLFRLGHKSASILAYYSCNCALDFPKVTHARKAPAFWIFVHFRLKIKGDAA